VILATNTQTNNIAFSKTALSNSKVVTTTNLINTITIPANYNKTITISIPVSVGLASGSMTCTALSTMTMKTTLSAFSINIAQNGVLLWNQVIPSYTSGTLTSTSTPSFSTNQSLTIVYDKFMAQFTGSFVPDLLDITATYDIYFTITNSILVTYSGATLSAFSGTPYTKINTTNFTSSGNLGIGIIGTVGTGGKTLSIRTLDDNNSEVIGNTYMNNLSMASPPTLSYTVVPTLTSKQIGYSVPCTLNAINIPTGTFTIVGKTTLPIPQAGCYTCFWNNFISVTGTSGVSSAFIYGVICSNTTPTYFGGKDYTQYYNQQLTTGQNVGFHSSSFFNVPSSGTYNVYLYNYVDYPAGTILTSSNVCNLQVIRTC
jgi:hypothetical protein